MSLVDDFITAHEAYEREMTTAHTMPAGDARENAVRQMTYWEQTRQVAARALLADAAERHHIEERVGVWLRLGADGWEIDTPTFDGYPLIGYDNGPLDSECECDGDNAEHRAVKLAGEILDLPTASALIDLLREARLLA